MGCPHLGECMGEITKIPMALGHDLFQEINEEPESNLPPRIRPKMNSYKIFMEGFTQVQAKFDPNTTNLFSSINYRFLISNTYSLKIRTLLHTI